MFDHRLFSARFAFRGALALAGTLLLTACDDSPEQDTGTATEAQTQGSPQGHLASDTLPPSREEALTRTADDCEGKNCPRVAIRHQMFEDRPALNRAVTEQLLSQLSGLGEQTEKADTLDQAAADFLDTAASVPDAEGWELTGEAKALGLWEHVLTVEINSYEFTGGAHGLPATRWLNWDLRQDQPISLGQVIQAGREDAFQEAARRAHQRWLEQEDNDEDDFRDTWPYQETSAFRLTRKGMQLHYDVYSIAPYAMGQPRLLIPWDELRELVRPAYRPSSG